MLSLSPFLVPQALTSISAIAGKYVTTPSLLVYVRWPPGKYSMVLQHEDSRMRCVISGPSPDQIDAKGSKKRSKLCPRCETVS